MRLTGSLVVLVLIATAACGCESGPARPTPRPGSASPSQSPFVLSSTVVRRTISAPSGAGGYAIALNCQGLLEYTADGGQPWSSRLFPRMYEISGLTAVSADHVNVLGFRGAQSKDQGRSFDNPPGLDGVHGSQAARDRSTNGLQAACTHRLPESCRQYAIAAPASNNSPGPPQQLSPSLPGSAYLIGNVGGREWLVTAEPAAAHSVYSTDAGKHWTAAEVPVTWPSPGTWSLPPPLELMPDPDGRGAWLGGWLDSSRNPMLWRFDDGHWSAVATAGMTPGPHTYVALDNGILATGGPEGVGYLRGDGSWVRDPRVPAGLDRVDTFADGTLVAASNGHPDWLYLANGHGTERNWTQVVVVAR